MVRRILPGMLGAILRRSLVSIVEFFGGEMMQRYELPELTDKSCLCPQCDEIGPVVATDARLGNIYECYYCIQQMEFPAGVLNNRNLTWAVVHGSKSEVIG